MKSVLNILLFTILILELSACVGTVEDKNALKAKNDTVGDSSSIANFEGLANVVPVAHDKIELYFKPASGSQDSIIYEIFVNNSPNSIRINGKTLTPNPSGLFVFTVTNLQMNMTYSFNMRISLSTDSLTATKIDPTKALSATTFNNETAEFLGISKVSLAYGFEGKDTVIVKWVSAKTIGGTYTPRLTDPVGYEVTYIDKEDGAINLNNDSYFGGSKKTVTLPNVIGGTQLYEGDSATIRGLTPGHTYFFRVRAIHKGYVNYKDDPTYKSEKNTRFLQITTLADVSEFPLIDDPFVTNPLGEVGLTKLNVSWVPAIGGYKKYILCYALETDSITPDFLTSSALDGASGLLTKATQDSTSGCFNDLGTSSISKTIENLQSYQMYHIKLLLCQSDACTGSARNLSSLVRKQVISPIAPFNGILSVSNPESAASAELLKTIKINFDPAVTTAGYLTGINFYCYDPTLPVTSTSPSVKIALDGTPVSNTSSVVPCRGLSVDIANTTIPTTFAGYETFKQITLKLSSIPDGSQTYCFSLVPFIESLDHTYSSEDTSNAVIKCVNPEARTPTIVQFTGKKSGACPISNKNLTVNWETPSGGLYTNYAIFYKEKTQSNAFFSFETAKTAYINNDTATYKWIDGIDQADTSYVFSNLTPGKTYNIGVLTYFDPDGVRANRRYSQINSSIGECLLNLPKAIFDEWVDVFAIGPKEDGMSPGSLASTVSRNYILEKLDSDGIPIEVDTDNNGTPQNSDVEAGGLQFNGIFGHKNADATTYSTPHKYSNRGIVKIGWKDVSLYNGSEKLNDNYIATVTGEAIAAKSLRKYGYKVYRSEDNQLTWQDLTITSGDQPSSNAGLLHPQSYTWRIRNNATGTDIKTERIVFFEDYSVQFLESELANHETDRARVYWYKVVPIFDGKELAYLQPDNPNHHIIKVTLPPRNMALVHRMMANRSMCLELGKSLKKNVGEFYSCEFSGLGSTGLSIPWSTGNTVYDQGGDLLVDRFELSCPFTRGGPSVADSSASTLRIEFKGLTSTGTSFKGCYAGLNPEDTGLESGIGTSAGPFVKNQIRPGDCIGSSEHSQATKDLCASPSTVSPSLFLDYHYPGAPTYISDFTDHCDLNSQIGKNIFDMTSSTSQVSTNERYFPIQSEFASIFYMRTGINYSSESQDYLKLKGADMAGSPTSLTLNKAYNHGSCYVNLNYETNTGEYRPRWLPVNALFGNITSTRGTTDTGLTFHDKKISEVRANTYLYDASDVRAPTSYNTDRLSTNSTLIRVATANSAKLPPLEGLSPSQLNLVCNSYKVNVGYKKGATGTFQLEPNGNYSKRLMRRREFIASSSWPQTYNEAKVTELEKGRNTSSNMVEGSCNNVGKITTTSPSTMEKGDLLTEMFPHNSKTNPVLFSGSSHLDSDGTNLVHSEKCVSRYGIQDLIGNMSESNTDQIFCDYSANSIRFGTVGSLGALSPPLASSSTTVFTGYTYDPLATEKPWVYIPPESGACSIVQATSGELDTYSLAGFFKSIYSFFGESTVDSSIIKQVNTLDQDSVNYSRNNNGDFLDFGQNGLAPKLDRVNSMRLSAPSATPDPDYGDSDIIAKWFNPILGMPLNCGRSENCDGNDNKRYSVTTMCNGGTAACTNEEAADFPNFPVNNSQVYNTGISTISKNDSSFTNLVSRPLLFQYAESVNSGAVVYNTTDSGIDTVGLINWKVTRNSVLKIHSGGDHRTLQSGRYSMNIYGNQESYEKNINLQNDGRCAVFIKDNQ